MEQVVLGLAESVKWSGLALMALGLALVVLQGVPVVDQVHGF